MPREGSPVSFRPLNVLLGFSCFIGCTTGKFRVDLVYASPHFLQAFGIFRCHFGRITSMAPVAR